MFVCQSLGFPFEADNLKWDLMQAPGWTGVRRGHRRRSDQPETTE